MRSLPVSSDPIATVMISTYNDRIGLLVDCIRSIIETTNFYLTPIEIIVTADKCGPELKEFFKQFSGPFRYMVYELNVGLSIMCNDCVYKEARGQYVIRMDDDFVLLQWGDNSRWLQLLLDPFHMTLRSPIYGEVVNVGLTGIKLMHHAIIGKKFLTGFLLATPVKVWKEVGGLDPVFFPGFNEEVDYQCKLTQLYYHSVLVGLNECVDFIDFKKGLDYNQFPGYHLNTASYMSVRNVHINRNQRILVERYGSINQNKTRHDFNESNSKI